jgi:signal transduction histidine kinase
LILLGTGYSVFRYRKLNKQKSEQRRLKERLAISQDLHDHVGSTLSSISVFSKVAQVEGEKGNTGQMNELLDRIRNTSSKMMTEMNDIVWAINPQNDTMEKIIQRMESFAKPLLAARNMQFHFNYDEAVKSLNLEMEQRKNFYLIFKEAVNNAIKYSGANLLEVNITYQHSLLELNVKDNGVGFNMNKEMNETKSLSGNGLKNMKARAKEMNASLIIESVVEKGASIRLILPLL